MTLRSPLSKACRMVRSRVCSFSLSLLTHAKVKISEHGLTACVAPVQPGTAPSADAKFDEIVDLLKANSDLMQIVDIASLIRSHDEAVIAKANERVYGALPDGQDYQSEASVVSGAYRAISLFQATS